MNQKKNTTKLNHTFNSTYKSFQANPSKTQATLPARKLTKVKRPNSLTYRNVPAYLIPMLRRRLNEDQPSLHTDTHLQTAPPPIKTSSSSCSFLAGSFTTMEGICSKYGACRVDKLEYGNHVSNIYNRENYIVNILCSPPATPPPSPLPPPVPWHQATLIRSMATVTCMVIV